MHKRNLLLLIVLLFAHFSWAQKKDLTLDDAIVGRWTYLYPEYVKGLDWAKGHTGTYQFTKDDGIYKQEYNANDFQQLLSFDDFKKSHQDLADLKMFPRLMWKDQGNIYLTYQKGYYHYNLATKKTEKITSLADGASHLDVSPDFLNIAYTVDNNLYITNKSGEVTVTTDNNREIVNGQVVHRNEFGVHKGIFWSPKNDKVAYYRNDQSEVTDYPLVDLTSLPAHDSPTKYPMAGMKSEKVTLGVFDINTQKTTFVKTTGPSDQYLTNVCWDPNGQFIYIAVLNRAQNELQLNKYDASTGEFVKTILEEKDDKYLSITHAMEFIPGKNEFLWRSERDGYEHVYLYNTDGKLINQVTKGDWVVTDVVGFDKKKKNLVVVGTDNDGLDRQIYKAALYKTAVTKISKKSGYYSNVKLDEKSQLVLATFTNLETPYTAEIMDLKGKSVKTILNAKNTLEEYQVSDIELFQIKAEDGSLMNCRMIKPVNFDESKKYPVLFYVYAGPGVQLIHNRWQASSPLWMQYAAQKGYIVFSMDSRGTENRGKDFEQVTHLNLGTSEVQDQLKGVEYLKNLPYVDADKMAVHGWSYGGFMTTSLMLKAPGTFKVGVAGGPVIDWSLYEVMYTERYMSTPQKNPEGFANAKLTDKITNLEGKLMLIHGMVDDVVVPQHSYNMIKSAVDNGVQIDFFPYPGHPHNVRGKDRVHLMRKVLDYIDLHLQ